ncbi:MAG: YcaO-like family protein [Gammaproteobacteria bacterium]|nr:YcaO-like family protein [Gammaproteobacteria bacterium]
MNDNSPYLDRAISPDDTLARVSRSFDWLGITRVADQTGLDRIGIPCFAAFRPNAKTLANNQGKGLTIEAARASAVMEAAEFAIAEHPTVSVRKATSANLSAQGRCLVDIHSQLPIGELLPTNKELLWVSGYNLLTRQEAFIPLDAVNLDVKNNRLAGICKSTNGLASGNNQDEAIFHGLCELIERDAGSLWSLKSEEKRAVTAIDPATWQDTEVIALLRKIEQAKLRVRLFDQTSDVGIPCVMAVIGEKEQEKYRHFDLAAGYGAHPNAARAAIRAITEAAQTRVTSIAGSRDDIIPGQYDDVAAKEHINLLQIAPAPKRSMTKGSPLGMPLVNLLTAALSSVLAISHSEDVFVFSLSDNRFDFSVVKVVAPFLEDQGVNTNWRPKERALKVLFNS